MSNVFENSDDFESRLDFEKRVIKEEPSNIASSGGELDFGFGEKKVTQYEAPVPPPNTRVPMPQNATTVASANIAGEGANAQFDISNPDSMSDYLLQRRKESTHRQATDPQAVVDFINNTRRERGYDAPEYQALIREAKDGSLVAFIPNINDPSDVKETPIDLESYNGIFNRGLDAQRVAQQLAKEVVIGKGLGKVANKAMSGLKSPFMKKVVSLGRGGTENLASSASDELYNSNISGDLDYMKRYVQDGKGRLLDFTLGVAVDGIMEPVTKWAGGIATDATENMGHFLLTQADDMYKKFRAKNGFEILYTGDLTDLDAKLGINDPYDFLDVTLANDEYRKSIGVEQSTLSGLSYEISSDGGDVLPNISAVNDNITGRSAMASSPRRNVNANILRREAGKISESFARAMDKFLYVTSGGADKIFRDGREMFFDSVKLMQTKNSAIVSELYEGLKSQYKKVVKDGKIQDVEFRTSDTASEIRKTIEQKRGDLGTGLTDDELEKQIRISPLTESEKVLYEWYKKIKNTSSFEQKLDDATNPDIELDDDYLGDTWTTSFEHMNDMLHDLTARINKTNNKSVQYELTKIRSHLNRSMADSFQTIKDQIPESDPMFRTLDEVDTAFRMIKRTEEAIFDGDIGDLYKKMATDENFKGGESLFNDMKLNSQEFNSQYLSSVKNKESFNTMNKMLKVYFSTPEMVEKYGKDGFEKFMRTQATEGLRGLVKKLNKSGDSKLLTADISDAIGTGNNPSPSFVEGVEQSYIVFKAIDEGGMISDESYNAMQTLMAGFKSSNPEDSLARGGSFDADQTIDEFKKLLGHAGAEGRVASHLHKPQQKSKENVVLAFLQNVYGVGSKITMALATGRAVSKHMSPEQTDKLITYLMTPDGAKNFFEQIKKTPLGSDAFKKKMKEFGKKEYTGQYYVKGFTSLINSWERLAKAVNPHAETIKSVGKRVGGMVRDDVYDPLKSRMLNPIFDNDGKLSEEAKMKVIQGQEMNRNLGVQRMPPRPFTSR